MSALIGVPARSTWLWQASMSPMIGSTSARWIAREYFLWPLDAIQSSRSAEVTATSREAWQSVDSIMALALRDARGRHCGAPSNRLQICISNSCAKRWEPCGVLPSQPGTMSLRVLLADFDVFSQVGGGQTFYRRVIERHPDAKFFYPSRGPDLRLRGKLPQNAEPFAIDHALRDPELLRALFETGQPPAVIEHCEIVCSIARARQGDYFDVVEVPSFRPCAHLIRGFFAEHGIRVHIVSLGLVGWLSASLRKADSDGSLGQVIDSLDAMEADSVTAADVRYTVSELHADENRFRGVDVGLVAMTDALEVFTAPQPEPPGSGPPDLWYVGRLDAAKGPDLFLEIAARLPRATYRRLLMTGPDNTWVAKGERWSDDLLGRARALNLDITYYGLLSDHELREQVYRGRSVIAIPSRTDTFNLVALEALANGCPVLLSRNTGAAGYLSAHFPAIAPPIVDPEDVDASADQLARLLGEYEKRSLNLRQTLRESPLPRAREGFMNRFWTREPSGTMAQSSHSMTAAIRAISPLSRPNAALWRPFPSDNCAADLTVVVVACDPASQVGTTMAALAKQTVQPADSHRLRRVVG